MIIIDSDISTSTHIDRRVAELDELIAARRRAMARSAAQIYAETKSLRKAAEQLGVSHETVRALVKEAERAEPR